MYVPNSKIKIEIVCDKNTRDVGFKASGVQPGDEKLLLQILMDFARISQTDKFRSELMKRALSKSWYKSKNPNVAPIWRKERGKPLEL